MILSYFTIFKFEDLFDKIINKVFFAIYEVIRKFLQNKSKLEFLDTETKEDIESLYKYITDNSRVRLKLMKKLNKIFDICRQNCEKFIYKKIKYFEDKEAFEKAKNGILENKIQIFDLIEIIRSEIISDGFVEKLDESKQLEIKIAKYRKVIIKY